MCKSENGCPEFSYRAVFDLCSPSFSMYHSSAAVKFRTSTAQLSAMSNGGFPHIYFPLLSTCLCVSATESLLSPDTRDIAEPCREHCLERVPGYNFAEREQILCQFHFAAF